MSEEEKNKPKQRHRLLVNPEELGLTGRIRKALLEREMGLTQKIKKAVSKVQEKESPWHAGRYQLIAILLLLLFSVLFGYFTFRTRNIDVTFVYPDKTQASQVMALPFYKGSREMVIQDYKRKVNFERNDLYGTDFGPKDYKIVDKDGKPVKDDMLVPNIPYRLIINKPGFKALAERTISVDPVNVKFFIELEPETIPRHRVEINIVDPLRPGEILKPDEIKLRTDKASILDGGTGGDIANVAVKPGTYAVTIKKSGYFDKDATITVREDGEVEETIPLEPKIRHVTFEVQDYLRDIWLREDNKVPEIPAEQITLSNAKGEVIDFQGTLMPGYYTLEVKRPGYEFYSKKITILPAEEHLAFPVDLKPMDRQVTIQLHYKINPKNANPDQAYLIPLKGDAKYIHLFENLNITPRSVPPGKYRLKVEKLHYLHVNEEIFVRPGDDLFTRHIDLIPMTKWLILQITSDYEVDPLVNPDEFLVDMRLAKKGYESVNWGELKTVLEGSKEQELVKAKLITLPVKIQSEIKSDLPGRENQLITPEIMTFTKLKGSEKVGETINLVEKGKFVNTSVKPAYYQLYIQHTGCDTITKRVLIEPSVDPKIIREKLTTKLIPLVFQIDSDYEPGKPVIPDEMLMQKLGQDARNIGPDTEVKPGIYTITLKKRGFHKLMRQLDIPLGCPQYEIKETFKAKMRRLIYNIKGEGFGNVNPERVTFDNIEVRENNNIVPKPGYVVEIQTKGYEVWKKNMPVEPSEEPFTLSAVVSPLSRKIIIEALATFPKGESLLPLDRCLIHDEKSGVAITIRGGTEHRELKPGNYTVELDKTGYELYKEHHEIHPGDDAYKITAHMKPKKRAANINIAYKIPSEGEVVPTVRLVSRDGTINQVLEKSGVEVIPEDYTLSIEAPGYETISEELRIAPSNAPWPLKRELLPSPRDMVITLKADYPAGEVFAEKTMLGGKEIGVPGMTIREQVTPGVYALRIDKEGYNAIVQGDFFVPAGQGAYNTEMTLVSKSRVVTYKVYDLETGQILIPDSITLDGEAVTSTRPFKPGMRQLIISVEGYEDYLETHEIPPGEGPVKLEIGLKATMRLVKYEIKGDYNNDPLTPTEITLNGKPVDGVTSYKPGDYNLVVYVPGYERLVDERVHISASRDDLVIRKEVKSKNRKVNFNITGSFPATPLEPDQVLFGENLVVNGEELKPQASGYQVVIEKEGYKRFARTVVFEPSENSFTLDAVLEARPRSVRFNIDGDYKPGMKIEPDGIYLDDGRGFKEFNALISPNKYKIRMVKAGYLDLEFEETIYPGDQPYTIKKTMVAKPRQVKVTVISDFDNQPIEAPGILTLGDKDILEESEWKPGIYRLSIAESGYQARSETIDVPPGEGPYLLERRLAPNKRRIEVVIAYDIAPGEFPLGAYTVHVTNQKGETFRVHTGDELSPGIYQIKIAKEGYETIHKNEYEIPPGRGNFELRFELTAKAVQLLIKITHDIEAPPDIKPVVVTLIDAKGQARTVTHGNWIQPGNYKLDIARPGYDFKAPNKPITIDPRTKPYWIDETLNARSRRLSFDMLYNDPDRGPRMVKAAQVLVDHREVKPETLFLPGRQYNVIAKFKEFKTVQKDMLIPPGEGAYVVEVQLTKLAKYEMFVGRKYADANGGMTLDGTRYFLELYADGERVEPHQIEFGEAVAGKKHLIFFAPKNMHAVEIYAAFYWDKEFKKDVYRFTDLRRIDVEKLVAHLEYVANSDKVKVLDRMESLLRAKLDKRKLRKFEQEDKEKLANFLRGMTVPDAEHQRKVDIIKKVLKK